MHLKNPRKKIYQILDGTLREEERLHLFRHFETCEECRLEWQSAQGLYQGLEEFSSSMQPSPGFEDRFWEKVGAVRKGGAIRQAALGFLDLLQDWLPKPALPQAAWACALAVSIGVAGGFLISFQEWARTRNLIPYVYSSGFRESIGIPQNSLTGVYLF